MRPNQPAAVANPASTPFRRAADIFLMIDSLETGGSERQFATVARALDSQKYQIHLGCIRARGPFLDDFSDVAMAQFRLGGSAFGFGSWRTRLRLAQHLKRNHIAVAHAFDFYTNLALIPAARLARIPVVIGSQRQLGDLLSPARFRAQLALLRSCDAVVCNSQAAAARLIQHGMPQARVSVIGNALPACAFAEARPALPRSADLLRVGMLARMNSPAKNHAAFLRVAARLKNKLRALEFVLVGDGPLRSSLEEEARRLGLAEQVRFLGDRRDVRSILASLDISVLPSQSESLSNVILESMAAGVPVAAYDVGGNRELVSDGRGILAARDNEQALAHAVERLLRDPALRQQLATKAQQFAQENFSQPRICRKYEDLYARLLQEKSWRPEIKPQAKPALQVAVVAASLRYVGGQSAQAELLVREWQNDPEIHARFIPIDPEFPRAIAFVGHIPGVRTLVREPIYLRQLWQATREADLVHIFSASYWSFLIAPAPAWVIARLRGKHVLIHYHSGEAPDHLLRFRSAGYVLKRADRLVAPSHYLVDVFRAFGIHAEVIPNVADLSRFCFRQRTALLPHLINTRCFHPYYCLDDVVRAFIEIKKAFPEARLDLVGTGPQERTIRTLVRESDATSIDFAGVADRDQVPLLYSQADIFINASRLDNMPVSILEAFASGTPVVSTAPAGIKYMVEHERTGLLCEVGDWQGLAQNVIRLLRDRALAARIIDNAHEEAQRYSWERVRPRWLHVYRSVVSGN